MRTRLKDKFCYLNIATFGMLHYYGSLHYEGKREYDISKKMSQQEADFFNRGSKIGLYKKGDKTQRIENKKELIKLAKKVWKKKFPKAIALILGSNSYAQPQLMLEGPTELKKKNNKLFYEIEKIYESDYNLIKQESLDKHRKICKKWEKLLKK